MFLTISYHADTTNFSSRSHDSLSCIYSLYIGRGGGGGGGWKGKRERGRGRGEGEEGEGEGERGTGDA